MLGDCTPTIISSQAALWIYVGKQKASATVSILSKPPQNFCNSKLSLADVIFRLGHRQYFCNKFYLSLLFSFENLTAVYNKQCKVSF